ncbi:MAG TPA: S9 family peptidase, partial [Polyangiaceae bacterium]|nr:S9 family peptidase [Polyangiaceae bacterium]
LTPARAVHFRRISDLRFSPDGLHLACVVSEPSDPAPESHIWVGDVRRNELRRFTSSSKSERIPRWSPDGRSLAFLSSRSGDMQVHILPIDGGEATALTSIDGGVSDYTWSPDGSRIAILARAPRTADAPSDDGVSDREGALERLWLIVRASGELKQLTNGPYRIDQIAWPKADHLLAIATDHPRREAWDTAIYRVGVADGRFTPIAHPPQPFEAITPSRDGSDFAYIATATKGPMAHDLFLQSAAGGDAHDVSKPVDRAVLDARWQDDTNVVALVADGFHYVLVRFAKQSRRPPVAPRRIDLPLSARAFDVARDGTIAFVGVGFDRLPELYIDSPKGVVRQMGRVQDESWSAIALADASLFRLASFDGTEIEAALLKPSSATPMPASGRPLVLLVHGGPNANFTAEYFWFNAWAQLLVARGYDVLLVNPRGSTGYGEAFLKANRADWGGGDFKDLMAALDHVIAGGGVDANRLGIGGWSYGAEMSGWAIGHTNRFKAAVAGGGVYDQTAEFETEDRPMGDEWHFGTPWDNPDVFARNSPMTFIRNAKTPTLLFHGDADRNNPMGQSLGLYRALRHLGVETELVIYPGEPHVPRRAKHQIDIMERMLRWYDEHLR